MSFIQLDGVDLSFGDRTIFTDVHLVVSPKSRIALTGVNGCGKSSLMKVAAGLMEHGGGRIIRGAGVRTAYLPQSGIVHQGRSLRDEALTAFAELSELEAESHRIAGVLENRPGNTESLLERYQEIQDILEDAQWDGREKRIEQVLVGLGFHREELHRDVGSFSGGWQMRIALSKILLTMPDILLLDEPTNYLDLEAREWLQGFIKNYRGGVLLVSHDRSFLDETCKQVAELLMTRLTVFKGNYSAFERYLEQKTAGLLERYRRQQEQIARAERFINRFRYKESKAAQVQSRIKMLAKIERIELPPSLKTVKPNFPQSPHSGRITVRAEGLERRYGDYTVFRDLDFELPRGSKTAVVGINGAGKTTLLRILSGEDDAYGGTLTQGSGVVRGYFSQDQEAVLDANLTVLEEAARDSDRGETALRTLLGAFLFTGDDIRKRVGVLSGGERNRLCLLKMLLEPTNLLILDEPTNHLDLTSKEALLNALQDYGGSMVIVSHDRYFLEKVADRVLEIENGRGRMYFGDYLYYRQRKQQEKAPAALQPAVQSLIPGEAAAMRKEQKQRQTRARRLRNEEQQLASELEEQERQASRIRAALEDPENYSDFSKAGDLSTRLEKVEKEIERILTAWEKTAALLEEAEST